MSDLRSGILELLRNADRPMKARLIAQKLSVERRDVNRLLYKMHNVEVEKLDGATWRLASEAGQRAQVGLPLEGSSRPATRSPKSRVPKRDAPGEKRSDGAVPATARPRIRSKQIPEVPDDELDPFEELGRSRLELIPFQPEPATGGSPFEAVDRTWPLFEDARPATWISRKITGRWRLVYEIGGPRSRSADSGPVSLPPDVATAWGKWTGVAKSDGEWLDTRLDEQPDAMGYERGDRWVRWKPSARHLTEISALEHDELGAEEDPEHYELFREYLSRHPILMPSALEKDPHYAERIFLRRVAIPLLGREVLELLKPQVPFRDPEGKQRYCDFVLEGQKTYAIEVEGGTYHAEQFVGKERFAEERLKFPRFGGTC